MKQEAHLSQWDAFAGGADKTHAEIAVRWIFNIYCDPGDDTLLQTYIQINAGVSGSQEHSCFK